ncbi:unnamed protein product [Cylindrotheca closterium]|uniref:Uncharacterized protein n=1 Tax=Cylindrotheca closterium TaxID=2856 RepID=A0AAD2FPB0_9STRA|nr:unnamed protein product [Cylindrotheca closterium]
MPNSSTRRGVTINPNVKVHEIFPLYEYTASEISTIWYNEDEMAEISRSCAKILRRLESVGSAKESKYCIRGLETHTRLGSVVKRSNRAAARAAVLAEQARQWRNEKGENGAQAICDAYRRTTSSCQMWAQAVGRRDQQEVEAYLCNDNDDVEEEEEEESVLGRKPSPSSTIACSPSQESRIVLRAANTASPSAKAA